MNESDETLWRSLDSSADLSASLSAEESFKSLLRCSDSSGFKSATVTPRKCGKALEDDFLIALRNLQIASTKKTSTFRPPVMTIEDNHEFIDNSSKANDSEIKNVSTIATSNVQIIDDNETTTPEPSTMLKNLRQESQNILEVRQNEKIIPVDSINYPEDVKIIGKSVDEKNDSTVVQSSLTPVEIPTTEESAEDKSAEETLIANSEKILAMAPTVLENMKKAVKPLLKPPVKKYTIGVSPMLQTRSRSRLPRLSPRQANQPATIAANKSKLINQDMKRSTSASSQSSASSRSSSLKRQSVKNVVATVVATKEGIKLKEEKISNFGIPVSIVKKKKRTQAVPFSFTTRDKRTQEEQKKLPMKDSNSLILKKQGTATKSLGQTSEAAKKFIVNDNINKENRNSILRSKLVTPAPKLSTEKRLKERKEFNDKVKEREKEIEVMKAKIEKKKLETKANLTPVFKVPAPVKSGRGIIDLQRPASALKPKK